MIALLPSWDFRWWTRCAYVEHRSQTANSRIIATTVAMHQWMSLFKRQCQVAVRALTMKRTKKTNVENGRQTEQQKKEKKKWKATLRICLVLVKNIRISNWFERKCKKKICMRAPCQPTQAWVSCFRWRFFFFSSLCANIKPGINDVASRNGKGGAPLSQREWK